MPTWCNNVIYWSFLSSTYFGRIRPSSGALDVKLQHIVFCIQFVDEWWSWEPLRGSCVRFWWCRAPHGTIIHNSLELYTALSLYIVVRWYWNILALPFLAERTMLCQEQEIGWFNVVEVSLLITLYYSMQRNLCSWNITLKESKKGADYSERLGLRHV